MSLLRDVLLIGPYPPPFGGPNVHIVYLRKELEERGVACEVINIGSSRRLRIDRVLPVDSGLHFVFQVARWVRRRFHVHHFFNAESPKAIALALAASTVTRLLGGSYSIGLIGGPRQKYLSEVTGSWHQLVRIPLRLSEFIVSNNHLVKDALRPLVKDPDKIVPIECFHLRQTEHVEPLPASIGGFAARRRPLICSAVSLRGETGRPHHEVELLIEAVVALKSAHPKIGCLVIGGGGCQSIYREMAAQARVAESFCFAGELDHAVCLGAMKAADVFVRAYNRDGSSSSIREALALLVPTVASRNPQHPEPVVQFDPDDHGQLAQVLDTVMGRVESVRKDLAQYRPSLIGEIDREVALLCCASVGGFGDIERTGPCES